jgi:DnaJ-class molecular chaperone
MAEEKIDHHQTCTMCNGKGTREPSGQTCEVCNGTGQMPIYEQEED